MQVIIDQETLYANSKSLQSLLSTSHVLLEASALQQSAVILGISCIMSVLPLKYRPTPLVRPTALTG